MYNYKLTIAYDGTHYCGWQVQSRGSSVQLIIQKGIEIIVRHPIALTGSGRTDSGVHALGQTAHFKTEKSLDCRRFLKSINGILPRDICIKSIDPAAEDFHARYSAIGKIYHYHLFLDPVMDPFRRLYYWHCYQKIDLIKLKEAASLFVGTRDYTSFANDPRSGSASRNPIRTIKRLEIIQQPGGVRLEFEANGFLYKMVRNITGTLAELASGKRELHEIEEIFSARDRRAAGPTAPPQGLFLISVEYP